MGKRHCPKCASASAWLVKAEYDIVLRCLCGYYKVVATQLNIPAIEDDERDAQDELKLPKQHTNLWVTLMVMASLEVASSAEITHRLHAFGRPTFTVSDVSSYLTILRGKGLVQTLENRRGTPGGSTWALTDDCIFLLGI